MNSGLSIENLGLTEEAIKELQKALEKINYKCEYYKLAMEKGTTSTPDFEEALAMRFLATGKK